MTTRILFVDDETHLLEGLRRTLRPFRKEWEMRFVSSGVQALEALDECPCDVVVSDMRMPGMDGAALLRQVRDRHPDVTRIVLSGHAEVASVLAVVNVAHQFLSKPCDGPTLATAIKRCCVVRERLQSAPLRRLANDVGSLPPVATSYGALVRALESPAVTVADLAAIVEEDVALCAKTLQLANSAFFGVTRQVTTVAEAVKRLGTNLLRTLVLSAGIFRWSEEAGPSFEGFSLEALQAHSLLTARIAMRLPDDKRMAEDAFTAGMLHDIGALLLAVRRPDEAAAIRAASVAEQRPTYELEAERFGATHADLGGYLLDAWGLPHSIVEAVAFHHVPTRVDVRCVDALAAVYLADRLARGCSSGSSETLEGVDEVTGALLARIGMADRLPVLEAEAAALAAGMGGA